VRGEAIKDAIEVRGKAFGLGPARVARWVVGSPSHPIGPPAKAFGCKKIVSRNNCTETLDLSLRPWSGREKILRRKRHRMPEALPDTVGSMQFCWTGRFHIMLDWLESPELRRRCHAGLNKGEQRHALAQAICTFRQGRIADRGAEAQEYRASGLNLLIAAIVYWNSTYMPDTIAHLRAKGEAVSDELLAHTSSVGWEHIGLSGDFLWERAASIPVGRRPLNLERQRRVA